MKISLITPSYNQGQFLEETIRSVLAQGYPNLELIIIDGGSSDHSVNVIRKFAEGISYWVSEPDCGQSHAINKGFAKASGDIFCWLNSDDYLEPGALEKVAQYFHNNPDCQWLTGNCRIVSESGEPVGMYEPKWAGREKLLRFWETDGTLPQPATFWRRELMGGCGVREDLHYGMDYDLWLRFSKKTSLHVLPEVLANYRVQPAAKTMSAAAEFLPELLKVVRPQWKKEGSLLFSKYELGWRKNHTDKLFNKAFQLKQNGKMEKVPALLWEEVKNYPFCLFQWKFLNLLVRVALGI